MLFLKSAVQTSLCTYLIQPCSKAKKPTSVFQMAWSLGKLAKRRWRVHYRLIISLSKIPSDTHPTDTSRTGTRAYKYLYACMLRSFSCVWLCATPWTVAPRLLRSRDSPGKKTGVGSHTLLQGNFPMQGWNRHSALQVDSLPSESPRKPTYCKGRP